MAVTVTETGARGVQQEGGSRDAGDLRRCVSRRVPPAPGLVSTGGSDSNTGTASTPVFPTHHRCKQPNSQGVWF